VTPDMREGQKGFVGYLPTPGSGLPEKAQRKPAPSLSRGKDDVIDHLIALGSTKDPSQSLGRRLPDGIEG
jgi:hypothetical protein